MSYIEEINKIIEKFQSDENNAVYADDYAEINSIIAKAQKEIDELTDERKLLDEKISTLQKANYDLLKRAIVTKDVERPEEIEEVEDYDLEKIEI